jgi:PiT family inorganic phosphate transporter
MAGTVGALAYYAAHGIGGSAGVLVMFLLVAVGGAAFYWRSRKNVVSAKNVNDAWGTTVVPVPAKPKTPVSV